MSAANLSPIMGIVQKNKFCFTYSLCANRFLHTSRPSSPQKPFLRRLPKCRSEGDRRERKSGAYPREIRSLPMPLFPTAETAVSIAAPKPLSRKAFEAGFPFHLMSCSSVLMTRIAGREKSTSIARLHDWSHQSHWVNGQPGTRVPTSAYLRMAMIWLSVKRDRWA